MEEILASIRRIIADDQSFPGHPHAGASAPQIPHAAAVGAPEADASVAPGESEKRDEAMHIPQVPSQGSDAAAPQETVQMASHTLADQTAADHMSADHAPADPAVSGHGVHAPQFASPEGLSPSLPSPPVVPEVAGVGSVDQELEAALVGVIPPEPEPAFAPSEEPAAPADALFSRAIDSSVTTAFNTLAASRLVANSDELRGLVREMIRPLLKDWIDEHLPQVVERLVGAEIERIARGG